MSYPFKVVSTISLLCLSTIVALGYGVRAIKAQSVEGPQQRPATSSFLTGTYREKVNHDEELARKIVAATAKLESAERDRQARGLLRALQSSRLFSIEQYGTTVIFNYPDGTRMPYDADGKTRIFRATRSVSGRVRVELKDNRLVIDLVWPAGDRLRLIYEKGQTEEALTFTRIASNNTVPTPVSISSEYERLSKRGARKFSSLSNQ